VNGTCIVLSYTCTCTTALELCSAFWNFGKCKNRANAPLPSLAGCSDSRPNQNVYDFPAYQSNDPSLVYEAKACYRCRGPRIILQSTPGIDVRFLSLAFSSSLTSAPMPKSSIDFQVLCGFFLPSSLSPPPSPPPSLSLSRAPSSCISPAVHLR
jgi:hypothetical protein